MNALLRVTVVLLALIVCTPSVHAQIKQSSAPADKTVTSKIIKALADAGIDPRTTSVQVITTSGHIVYLKGLISDKSEIALAGKVAAQNAPGYKIENKIISSFFDDPNHVTGGQTK